jgi:hypothetical protein
VFREEVYFSWLYGWCLGVLSGFFSCMCMCMCMCLISLCYWDQGLSFEHLSSFAKIWPVINLYTSQANLMDKSIFLASIHRVNRLYR